MQLTKNLDAEVAVVYTKHIASALIDAGALKQETRRDPILSRVLNFEINWWFSSCPSDLLQGY